MISTRELAVLAGVSQSTVSRCLNDHPAISAETKERVRTLAREKGYILQHKNKKVLFSAERKAIGILLTGQPFFEDLFINHMMSTLYQVICSENYYAMPLPDYTSENDGVERLRDLVKLDIIKGFIIVNRKYDEKIHSYLDELGIPHVYLLHCSRHSFKSINVVDTDNYCGGYLGTRHLLMHGHREIVSLSCPWREFEDRTDGYIKALREFGVVANPEYVLCGDCTYEDGYSLVAENIRLFSRATAIYAQSDLMAFGAVNALKDRDFRVPYDVSVIGSDGYDLGIMCRPQLDSVAHPVKELAEEAVRQVLELSGNIGKRMPRQTILQPYIIHRGSVCERETN